MWIRTSKPRRYLWSYAVTTFFVVLNRSSFHIEGFDSKANSLLGRIKWYPKVTVDFAKMWKFLQITSNPNFVAFWGTIYLQRVPKLNYTLLERQAARFCPNFGTEPYMSNSKTALLNSFSQKKVNQSGVNFESTPTE